MNYCLFLSLSYKGKNLSRKYFWKFTNYSNLLISASHPSIAHTKHEAHISVCKRLVPPFLERNTHSITKFEHLTNEPLWVFLPHITIESRGIHAYKIPNPLSGSVSIGVHVHPCISINWVGTTLVMHKLIAYTT